MSRGVFPATRGGSTSRRPSRRHYGVPVLTASIDRLQSAREHQEANRSVGNERRTVARDIPVLYRQRTKYSPH
jgi:hypothetical protein